MRVTVYKVDARTMERGPVLREIVVPESKPMERSAADSFGEGFPPCSCVKCVRRSTW
jgi:hypothetical protein